MYMGKFGWLWWVGAWCLGVGIWLGWTQEVVLVDIEAERDESSQLPVYAQFVVTQRMDLDKEARISGVQLPLYIPEGSIGTLRVTLSSESNILVEGDINVENLGYGLHVVHLGMTSKLQTSGVLELEVDGSDWVHRERDNAPRVFIEKADYVYAKGNYRIANNEKEGDVSLRVLQRRRRVVGLFAKVLKSPVMGLFHVGIWMLIILWGGFLIDFLWSFCAGSEGE